jgi:ring-1,2-phenylacetyl-CoA epoxidase subunit PaaC
MRADALFEYLLRLGDTTSSSRSAWRVGRPRPVLEEDIALANVGLDPLGQARMWLSYAGEVEGEAARGEDELAFLRDRTRSATCSSSSSRTATSPITMARQFYFDHAHLLLLRALRARRDARIAEIAAKARRKSRTTSSAAPTG